MNERKTIKLYSDEKLKAWAEWSRRWDDRGHGWKRRVAWLSLGTRGPSRGMPLLLATDDEGLETERAIHALDDVYQQVIITYYLHPSTREEMARQCHCSMRAFYYRLAAALVLFFHALQAVRQRVA